MMVWIVNAELCHICYCIDGPNINIFDITVPNLFLKEVKPLIYNKIRVYEDLFSYPLSMISLNTCSLPSNLNLTKYKPELKPSIETSFFKAPNVPS